MIRLLVRHEWHVLTSHAVVQLVVFVFVSALLAATLLGGRVALGLLGLGQRHRRRT